MRVLMIGLDAGEPSLIERWTADGSLPNLAKLKASGVYGRLASSAEWLVGSPWPSFYTSSTPADHGFYHYLLWHPDRMATARPTDAVLPMRPFWRDLGARARVLAVDVPLTYNAEPFNGVEIAGYGTHETLIGTASSPPELLARVTREFGAPARLDEIYDLSKPKDLLRERDSMLAITRQVTDMTTALMRRESWDLGIVCYVAPHRVGHRIWNLTGLGSQPSVAERPQIEDALRQVYIGCDRAIGRLCEAAGPAATAIVFSVHGMGENTCRTELLEEMLDRVLTGRNAPRVQAGKTGGLKRLRKLIPVTWRHEFKRRLPQVLQDQLTAYWRTGGVDWSRTRAVSLLADLQGYIRINLKGREAEGVVAPGEDYENLCAQISEGLATFRDVDTGDPVVSRVGRSREVFGDGERVDRLPDLLVRWSTVPAARHRAIESQRFGAIPWPTPGLAFTGRSGNHQPEGFVVAAGPGISPARLDGADVMDLAPTVHALLGVPVPARMKGRPLAAVAAHARGATPAC